MELNYAGVRPAAPATTEEVTLEEKRLEKSVDSNSGLQLPNSTTIELGS